MRRVDRVKVKGGRGGVGLQPPAPSYNRGLIYISWKGFRLWGGKAKKSLRSKVKDSCMSNGLNAVKMVKMLCEMVKTV